MEPLKALASLEGRFRRLRGPGAWFWLILFVGAALRVCLVLFTEGTYDALVWEALSALLVSRRRPALATLFFVGAAIYAFADAVLRLRRGS